MMIFNELRKHRKLASKRNPMYEKNKFGKFWVYIGAAFWAAYLIFFGIIFPSLFEETSPNMEPYYIMNGSILIFILIADFLFRFAFQQTPTQEVKPYLLLPIKKKRLIDFLLIRSGLSSYNYIWLFLFIPFSFLTITKYFGFWGVFTYCLGIWLLMIINNYWYLFCKTLIDEHICWIILPIVIYGAVISSLFIPKESLLFYILLDIGNGYIEGNLLYFIGTITIIAFFWLANRQLMNKLIYAELSKTKDNKVKHISEFHFFEIYGEIGEFMRLEIKMLLRNKRPKTSFNMILVAVVIFSAALSFTDVYDSSGNMKLFIIVYAFIVFAMTTLLTIMGYEGNYLDGLMSCKETIRSLLQAKYYMYSLFELLPLILMLPAIITGKITFLSVISIMFFTVGFMYFLFFQLAVYNNNTEPLNEKLTGRQSGGKSRRLIVSFAAFIIPMVLYNLFMALMGEVMGEIILLFIGLGFMLTSRLWINNIYQRVMKNRYKNMEGFRDSRV
ncbi:MAG: DUF5687 family protein [Bacteroidaceae bacterium]